MKENNTTDSNDYQIPGFGNIKITRARIIGYVVHNERDSMFPITVEDKDQCPDGQFEFAYEWRSGVSASMIIPATVPAWQVNVLVCAGEDCYYNAACVGVTHDTEFNHEEWIEKAKISLKQRDEDIEIEAEMRDVSYPPCK